MDTILIIAGLAVVAFLIVYAVCGIRIAWKMANDVEGKYFNECPIVGDKYTGDDAH